MLKIKCRSLSGRYCENNVRYLSAVRERMFYDVVVVGAGTIVLISANAFLIVTLNNLIFTSASSDIIIPNTAGPAGLSAAIRLKQIALENNREISVCVVEKGAEIGSHILSGNVFETTALDELLPDWALDPEAPLKTRADKDSFKILTGEKGYFTVPNFLTPPELHNEGNYIISLSQLVRWLGNKAELLGVEIYPGFSAAQVLYGKSGQVIGIATKDAGIRKDSTRKDSFTQGIELHARQTFFAEGARGSCSEEVIEKFSLREGRDVQSYGERTCKMEEYMPIYVSRMCRSR